MKKILISSLIVFLTIESFAQNKIALDTLFLCDKTIAKKAYRSINVFDTVKVEIFNGDYRKKTQPLVFINDDAIDSSQLIFRDPIKYDNSIIFKVGGDDQKLVSLDLTNKSFSDYGYNFFYNQQEKYLQDESRTKLYSKEHKNFIRLYLIDPKTKKETLFADFSKYDKKKYHGDEGSYPSEIDDVYFINDHKAIVKVGVMFDAERFEVYRYFIVDNGNINEITDKVFKGYESYYDIMESRMSFISEDKKYIREITVLFQSNKKFSHLKDNDYNTISNVLGLGSFTANDYREPINGVNIQNGRIVNYFLNSQLNNGTKVIVPYKFIPRLDIAMYKIYNDTLVTKEELADFGRYELGILRNLIFAKHNYDFSTEFYQAYFNLYAFYNDPEMRKSRTKDINGKLTESDKTNLRLIKTKEAEIKH